MSAIYNHFTKSETSKTGYVLELGEPIISHRLYVIEPRYVHGRSPAFTIVSKEGKHISGFFPVGNGYLGDFKKQILLCFLTNRGLDLFLIPSLSAMQAREMLLNGRLNDELFRARQEAERL